MRTRDRQKALTAGLINYLKNYFFCFSAILPFQIIQQQNYYYLCYRLPMRDTNSPYLENFQPFQPVATYIGVPVNNFIVWADLLGLKLTNLQNLFYYYHNGVAVIVSLFETTSIYQDLNEWTAPSVSQRLRNKYLTLEDNIRILGIFLHNHTDTFHLGLYLEKILQCSDYQEMTGFADYLKRRLSNMTAQIKACDQSFQG